MEIVDTVPVFQYVIITGDIAHTLDGGDHTAFLVWGYADDIWYLIAAHRMQTDQPGVIRFYRKLDDQYEPDKTVIEKNGIGNGVIQHLNQLGYKHVDGVTVKGSKNERAENITPLLESKKVAFLKSMPLFEPFMDELLRFPSGKTDDMVDAFTLALTWRKNILREANRFRRPKRKHLPRFQTTKGPVSLANFGSSSSTRDRYSERTGRSVLW